MAFSIEVFCLGHFLNIAAWVDVSSRRGEPRNIFSEHFPLNLMRVWRGLCRVRLVRLSLRLSLRLCRYWIRCRVQLCRRGLSCELSCYRTATAHGASGGAVGGVPVRCVWFGLGVTGVLLIVYSFAPWAHKTHFK